MSDNPYFSSIPHTIDYTSLLHLLHLLDELNVCRGNPDTNYLSMAEACKGKFFATYSDAKAYLDKFPVRLNGTLYQATVRTSSYSLVITSGKCDSCKLYRP